MSSSAACQEAVLPAALFSAFPFLLSFLSHLIYPSKPLRSECFCSFFFFFFFPKISLLQQQCGRHLQRKCLELIHLISSTETKQKDQLQLCHRFLTAWPGMPLPTPLCSLPSGRYFCTYWGNVVAPLNKVVRSVSKAVFQPAVGTLSLSVN